MKDKVPVGLNVNNEYFNALGKTGGEETHTLTTPELPSAIEILEYVGAPQNTWGLSINNTNYIVGGAIKGQAHNNLQPYMTVNYIIKAKNSSVLPDVSEVKNTYNTSIIDTYSCNYINNIIKDEYITVKLSSSQGSMTDEARIVIFDTILSSAGNLFTLQADGGIKINRVCSIEVSATLRFGYSGESTKLMSLYKNSERILQTSVQNATAVTETICPININANANDVIYLKGDSASAFHEFGTFMSLKRNK